MQASGQPILVLKEGTERERGRDAQGNNIMAARAIADAVRSTLGPKGMDKMLVGSLGDVVITNDGVTILKELSVEHPAAKMVVEVAQTQDRECGDGTTTAVVLAGELLRRCEDLAEDIHPTLIAQGFRLAEEEAVRYLREYARDGRDDDVLRRVAATAMTGKSVQGDREFLAELAVRAVRAVAEEVGEGESARLEVDVDNVKVETAQGGSLEDTELVEGVLIRKDRVHSGMPDRVDDARIALLDAPLEVQKTETDAEVQITDPTQLQSFLDEEEAALREAVDALEEAGATVVFCQKGIDDLAQHFLAKAGIYAVRRVKKSDMERLAKATGGRLVSQPRDVAADDLGRADLVDERKVGNDDLTFVTGCEDPKAVSVLVRGGSQHVIDEAERTLDDALSVVAVALEDGKVLPGAGAPEVAVAQRLREHASGVGGREQLAIEAFAEALESIPKTLAENAGLDAIDTLIELRSAHEAGNRWVGLDVTTGETVDLEDLAVVEPLRVKVQAIQAATEVATMVIRIDDVIAAKGGGDEGPPGGPGGAGGMGGMPGGMGGMGGMGGGMPPGL